MFQLGGAVGTSQNAASLQQTAQRPGWSETPLSSVLLILKVVTRKKNNFLNMNICYCFSTFAPNVVGFTCSLQHNHSDSTEREFVKFLKCKNRQKGLFYMCDVWVCYSAFPHWQSHHSLNSSVYCIKAGSSRL